MADLTAGIPAGGEAGGTARESPAVNESPLPLLSIHMQASIPKHSQASAILCQFLFHSLVVLALVTIQPGVSHAASDRELELERWVVSGSVEMGLHGFSAKANARSSDIIGAPQPPINQLPTDGPYPELIDPIHDRNDVLSALIGGTLEVMTPQLLRTVGKPRLFLVVNLSGVLTSERSIVRDGDPGPFTYPDIGGINTPGDSLIGGQGTQVRAQSQNPYFAIGLGPAFTFDLWESRIRIKPSVVYSRHHIDLSAITQRAIRTEAPAPTLDSYRLISLTDDREKINHSLGPALEVEVDTDSRFGPFLLSVYIKGHAGRILGDRETDMQQANPDVQGEFVRWHYESETWTYRASTGMRFRWVPKRK
jgi:hypothetical protein